MKRKSFMAVGSTSSGVRAQIQQVNDSLYEVHSQEGTPTMQILLFHGLPSGDSSAPHLSTWKTENGSWLWKWLAEDFRGAHIYMVSYQKLTKSCDMYPIEENLIQDLMLENIGQFPYRPVILVGHCVGGLVIKAVCSQAHERLHLSKCKMEREKLESFLENLRGIFYYGTPHRGSSRIANASDGPLFGYFKTLDKEAARLNFKFDQLCGKYKKWQIYGLGESLPTKSAEEGVDMRVGVVEVPEASSRAGDNYRVVAADHISICQPQNKIDSRFSHLKKLIDNTMTIIDKEKTSVQEQKKLQEEVVQEEKTRVEQQMRVQEEVAMEEARRLDAYPENFQQLPSELTGVEEQVKTIIGKLDDVRILCLVGMGGLGKTTLARVVFNKLCRKFEFTCFIQDIKLITGNIDDVKDKILQRLHQGGKRVEGQYNLESLRGKKVLCVLDDISDRENEVLSYLAAVVGLESRFVVTCRDQVLLKISHAVHKVELLNEDNSKQLFMKCVFPDKEVPLVELERIVGAIVKKCDGLPLTLKVLGKYVENEQSYERWEQTLNALEKAEDVSELNEKLWAKLRLSYSHLGGVEQQMFLDATNFFDNKHWTLREAKVAWRAAYGTRSEGLQWKTLVDRSLVYHVEEDDYIKVHEQLQSLGRKIATEPNNYGKYRVWDGKTVVQSLQNTTNELDGKEIHAWSLDPPSCYGDIHISRTALQILRNVKFLDVMVPVFIDGGTDGAPFPTKVVFLSCVGHHTLFDPALQTQLAILKLFHLDYLPTSIAQLSSLNSLEIKLCANLCFAHEFFNNLSSLRLLKLDSCQGFQSLPESVKCLSALKCLEFTSCHDLCTLPESFGQLSSLSHLTFNSCNMLSTLPESFGQLSSLSHLTFIGTFTSCHDLRTLPESFGQLSSLSYLTFTSCHDLRTLPESFGQLSSLSYLTFTSCHDLRTLPESFGQLSSLSHLTFNSCTMLSTLPKSFGQLSSLSHLTFTSCYDLRTLPESFGPLSSLRHLTFDTCTMLSTLPESFGQLSSLSHLRFECCNMLSTLPESFGQLSSLSHLKFDFCTMLSTLPESFGQLSSLSHLQFDWCYMFSTLPESFGHLSSLSELTFYNCEKLSTLPESFGQLSSLSHLTFFLCNMLSTLPESFGQLSSLSQLNFYYCEKLSTLPESFGQLSSLSHLTFHNCEKLSTLPKSFMQLSSLSHLTFDRCYMLSTLPESFGQLSSLNHLTFRKCYMLSNLPKSFGQLSSLSYLTFEECNMLSTLPESFGQLSSLSHLPFRCCNTWSTLPESFGQLSSLSHLTFDSCNMLSTLPESFVQLSSLSYLYFDKCEARHTLPSQFGQLIKLPVSNSNESCWGTRRILLP